MEEFKIGDKVEVRAKVWQYPALYEQYGKHKKRQGILVGFVWEKGIIVEIWHDPFDIVRYVVEDKNDDSWQRWPQVLAQDMRKLHYW